MAWSRDIDALQEKTLYRIKSRNLDLALWTGKMGKYSPESEDMPQFIGIRRKFDYEYLTIEFGWAWENLEINIPEMDINFDSKPLFEWLKNMEKLNEFR